jgi:hypothetical protein
MMPPQPFPPLDPPPRRLPPWNAADLPQPPPLSWRHWTRLIGPGIVMMGIQIGGGEWLFGPEITARYGGGLMWIATVAIVLQVFYNIECGRYALYCGEPVLTGFMRLPPRPRFWVGVVLLLNLGALIPGLSTHGAALLAALYLGHPPGESDRWLVTLLAYVCLGAIALPVLLGGKVYNTLQALMTAKVLLVLGFCLAISVTLVSPANWWNVLSGFVKFGNVPVTDADGRDRVANVFVHYWSEGGWPVVAVSQIAILGAFAGYAGGGGLANSTYSNFVRDKGWGMGGLVGAIPSAIGGRHVALSHVGTAFPPTAENLHRWRGWWRHLLTDQLALWAPGCFLGMALPALLSIEFARYSELSTAATKLEWSQAIISADGLRHAPGLSTSVQEALWVITLLVGLLVMLPGQMSIMDDVSRRWTDALWTASRRVREGMQPQQVKWIYYSILGTYVFWSFVCAYLFSTYGTPKLMTIVVANLGNVAIGATSFFLLWTNLRLLPAALQPRWYSRVGLLACGVFYLGLAGLVFVEKQWPVLRGWLTERS